MQKAKKVKNSAALPIEIQNYIFKCILDKREKEKEIARKSRIMKELHPSLLIPGPQFPDHHNRSPSKMHYHLFNDSSANFNNNDSNELKTVDYDDNERGLYHAPVMLESLDESVEHLPPGEQNSHQNLLNYLNSNVELSPINRTEMPFKGTISNNVKNSSLDFS